MKAQGPVEQCIRCVHFRNSPAYLESVFKGMNTMSSGHASVRKDDGVCLLHDIYLSADSHCEQFRGAACAHTGAPAASPVSEVGRDDERRMATYHFGMGALYWLDPDNDHSPFPPVERALRDPDGLLAVGGNLAPERLISAYRQGIFPWYSDDQPILWWSPDPRSVLFPDRLRISRSLRKTLRRQRYLISFDRAFDEVVLACAQPRPDQAGTWITPEMMCAYARLHAAGVAHSVEAWENGELAGGLYGLAIGKVFFGESMFARRTDASKAAFVHLVRQLRAWGYGLVDCQVQSAHLDSLGAENIPRSHFIQLLTRLCDQPGVPAPWELDPAIAEAQT